MKANRDSDYSRLMDVYIDGVKTTDCVEANEEKGMALMLTSPTLLEKDAPVGSFIVDGMVAYVELGKVEMRIDYPNDVSKEEVHRHVAETFQSIVVAVKGSQATFKFEDADPARDNRNLRISTQL